MTTSKGRSAWLLTWEWAGQHAAVSQPVAAILPYQTGPETVRVLVERLYASHASTAEEMLHALPPRGRNPYRASFGSVRVVDEDLTQVIPYTGQVLCGHNPYLFARLVTGLRVGTGTYEDGPRRLVWNERPHPGVLRMPDVSYAAPLEPPDDLTRPPSTGSGGAQRR